MWVPQLALNRRVFTFAVKPELYKTTSLQYNLSQSQR